MGRGWNASLPARAQSWDADGTRPYQREGGFAGASSPPALSADAEERESACRKLHDVHTMAARTLLAPPSHSRPAVKRGESRRERGIKDKDARFPL